ncbi:MAG: hypothetical protein LBI95_00680, partial [Holosporales bacterium]|nr:hypothetical protein [Holosporales bacterium]
KGNIDNIVKEVKEKAEEVKASTGMNKDVDDSMNKFGSYVYNGKNLLKEIWDKAKKLQEKQQLEKQQLEKQQLEKQQLEKQQLEKQQLEKPPSQLSETERFNRWIAFLKEDLEVVYSIIGGFKLEASLNNVKNLESMTLPDKKNWEASVIRDILIAFNDVMKKLDELIIQPNLPLTEKLQYLGVKATFYINKANWVGIKEKVCNLRWKIEVATKGNNLEEGYNRLNDELEALKKEIEERNKCCYSLKCLNDEIWKWINEVKDVNNLPEKEALRSLSENVLEAKKAIERGEDLPKLETFKGEFNKIKESNSLEGIKEKFDLLNELDGFLKSLNDIVDSFKSGERIKLEQEIKEINKKKNEKSFKNEVGNLRSRVKKFKDEAMEFEKKPLQQLNKCLPLLKKDWMFVLDLLNIRNGKLRDKLLDALARFDKIESEALKWKREFVQDVSVILLDVFEAAVERLNGLIQATSSPIEKLKYLGVKAILHIYNANKVGITEKVYELREKIEGSSSEEDYNRLNGELEKLMTEVEVRDKCWHSFSDLHYSIDFLEGGRWVRKSNAVIAFDRTVTNAVASIEAGDELPKLEEFQARFDELQQKK